MKNFKKVLAVLTAVSAMAAQASAFAANEAAVSGGVAGTYAANEDGAYKLSVTTPAAAKAGKDMTLLVLTEGALTDDLATENVDESAVADTEILYIDQGIAGTDNFADLGLKNEIINAVTTTGHIVKVGYYDADGNFAIAEGTIAVTAIADEPKVKTFKVVWGDTTGDNKVDGLDSVAVLKSTVGISESYSIKDTNGETMSVSVGNPLYENGFIWGNVNNDEVVDGLDSVAVLKATVGISETYTFNGSSVSVDASETPATVDIVVPVSAEN